MSPALFGGGGGAFFPTNATSKRIYANDETITSAKLTATSTGTVGFALSADDGLHWEAVANGFLHSFATTGKYLKWKATLNPGSSISRIEVEY